MKKIFSVGFILIVSVLLFGCTSESSKGLSVQQKKESKNVEIPLNVFQGTIGNQVFNGGNAIYKGPDDFKFEKDNLVLECSNIECRMGFSNRGGYDFLVQYKALLKGNSTTSISPSRFMKCRILLRKKGEETYEILNDNVKFDEKNFYVNEQQIVASYVEHIPVYGGGTNELSKYEIIFEMKPIF